MNYYNKEKIQQLLFVNTSHCQTFWEHNIVAALIHHYIIMHNYSWTRFQTHRQQKMWHLAVQSENGFHKRVWLRGHHNEICKMWWLNGWSMHTHHLWSFWDCCWLKWELEHEFGQAILQNQIYSTTHHQHCIWDAQTHIQHTLSLCPQD